MPNHKNRVGRTTKDYRKEQRERLKKQEKKNQNRLNQTPEDPKTGRPRNEVNRPAHRGIVVR